MSNGRFATALHALALLAEAEEGYPSSSIAGSVNTGAPHLRRILSTLAKAGIVEAREGRDGGYRLARPAGGITLADVYRATAPGHALAPSPTEPNPDCPIGSGMRRAFADLAGEVDGELVAALGRRSVADIAGRATAYGISGSREEGAGVDRP